MSLEYCWRWRTHVSAPWTDEGTCVGHVQERVDALQAQLAQLEQEKAELVDMHAQIAQAQVCPKLRGINLR